MENHYSNIIAPSDGVRRFLCRKTVILMGLAAVVYSFFAFRMNMLEHDTLGESLRSNLLYAAYVMFPLGVITAAVFARVRSMGLAYSMISLMVALAGIFMMFLNALSALLRERDVQGIAGGLLEFLTMAAAVAVCFNLVMSCMDFKLVPVWGNVGAVVALLATVITVIRIALSFSAMSFAWNQDFDWNNLSEQIRADKLQHQAAWIFRSIPMNAPKALQRMFRLRFYERIASCGFSFISITFFLKYKNEMSTFNKLMDHAREYVDIPQAHIAESIAATERAISERFSVRTSAVKERLRHLTHITQTAEETGDMEPLISELGTGRMYDDVSDRRSEGYEEQHPRRRSEGYEEQRPRRRSDGYEEQRPRRRSDGYEEQRPRRRSEGYEEQRPRRRSEGYEEQRPRRRSDGYEEQRPRRRSDGYEDEMTEEERYLMQERRRRDPYYDEERRQRQASRRTQRRMDEEQYRREREHRRQRAERRTQQELNDYYDNYMQRREQQSQNKRRPPSNGTGM